MSPSSSSKQPRRRHLRIFWAKKYVTQNSESRKMAPSLCHRRGNMPTGAVKHSVPWGLKQLTIPERKCSGCLLVVVRLQPMSIPLSCNASSRTCPLYIFRDAQFCQGEMLLFWEMVLISADGLDLHFMYRLCLF